MILSIFSDLELINEWIKIERVLFPHRKTHIFHMLTKEKLTVLKLKKFKITMALKNKLIWSKIQSHLKHNNLLNSIKTKKNIKMLIYVKIKN